MSPHHWGLENSIKYSLDNIIIQKMHNMEKQHLKCYFNAILHLLETSMIMWSLNYLKGVVETPNFS